MTLDIEHDRRFSSTADLRRLIVAVTKSTAHDEARWIETKSTLDLTTKHTHFIIAKNVLGFANRLPASAAEVAKGTAYLIIGADHERVHGVVGVDLQQLENGVETYLGASRLGWTPRYVEVDGTNVLTITVDAPELGDTIWTLGKPFESFSSGTIFVRRHAQTVPADQAEVAALVARARSETEVPFELTVSPSRTTFYGLDIGSVAVQEWCEARKLGLVNEDPPQSTTFSYPGHGVMPDPRTPAQLVQEILDHVTKCTPLVPTCAIKELANYAGTHLVVRVQNETSNHIDQLELELQFPPDVFVYDGQQPNVWEFEEAPWPPQTPAAIYHGQETPLSAVQFYRRPEPPVPTAIRVLDPHVVRVTFPTLRPSAHDQSDPIAVVPTACAPGSSFTVTWKAWSTSAKTATRTGSFDVGVGPDLVRPVDLLATEGRVISSDGLHDVPVQTAHQ